MDAADHDDTLMSDDEYARLQEQIQQSWLDDSDESNSDSNPDDAAGSEFKFWKTQPVPGVHEIPTDHGPIDALKSVADVQQEPHALHAGLHWCGIDLQDAKQLDEVYVLLRDHYVEDDDNMFRFDYSRAFLRWALTPPGYRAEWHVGVRNGDTDELVAFISGVPARGRVYTHAMPVAVINFLCVHKDLRARRLAPVLIKEVTRRVNLQNVWQAVYTAGVELPTPVASCPYYHRSLNPKKLVETGFSLLPPRITLTQLIKMYKLPPKPLLPGFRMMEKKDVGRVAALLQPCLAKCDLVIDMDEDDVAHWLLPRDGVVYSYVVEDPETNAVTDFCSFYNLPSTVIDNEQHDRLNAAYSFYNAATSVSLAQLMQCALIMAVKAGFDVFNALELMDNIEFLHELRFSIGDGDLYYYLFNWRCPRMAGNQVAVVPQ